MIGVFDSGIGGLTVLRELLRAFPGESFLFLGDTARLPYGSKSRQTIRRYLIQNINFLSEQSVSAVVVACNSASSVLSETDSFNIPVLGVIEPGARLAVGASKNGKIGVLGTRATVMGEAYLRAIQRLDETVSVFQSACPLLVPLVEEGMTNDAITREMVRRYCEPLVNEKVDTAILGCTHYPVLKSVFRQVLGPDVALIESGAAIAELLRERTIARVGAGDGRVQIALTDFSPVFQDIAERLLADCPVREIDFQHVQI